MTKQSYTLFQLAASIEEILDASLEDARIRSRHYKTILEKIDQLELSILANQQTIHKAVVTSPLLLNSDSVTIKRSTIFTIAKHVIQWMLPVAVGVYESIKAILHH